MFAKKREFKHDKDSFHKSLGVKDVKELVDAHIKIEQAMEAFSNLKDDVMKSEMIELLYNMAKEDDTVFLVVIMRAYDMFRAKSIAIAVPPPAELLKHVREFVEKMADGGDCEDCKEEECDEKTH